MQKGGTLLTFASAGDLPIQRFGLPVRNIVNGLPSKTFWSPGSTLRVTFNNSNPLAYGMPNEGLALFMAGGQVYEIVGQDRSQDVEILTTYVERDILQSGWLLGEQVIAKKAAAVSVKHGAGKVVLIGYRPQHRDQTHGTFKMVFNALLNGPSARSDVNDHGAATGRLEHQAHPDPRREGRQDVTGAEKIRPGRICVLMGAHLARVGRPSTTIIHGEDRVPHHRNAPRPVRNRRRTGCRRHGRGLSRARPKTES